VGYCPRRQSDHGWPGSRSRPSTRCGRRSRPKRCRSPAKVALGTTDRGPSSPRAAAPYCVKSAAAVAVAATSPKSASPRPLHSCRAVANPAILSFIDRTVFMRDQGRRVNRENRLTVASFRWRWRGSSGRQSPKEILNWTSDLPVPQRDWCFIADRVPHDVGTGCPAE
jgi:hypothetical protein